MNVKVISKELKLTAEWLDASGNQVDLTKLMSFAIQVSGDHDCLLRQHFNETYITDNQSWVITQNTLQLHQPVKVGMLVTVDTRLIEVNRFFVTRRYSVMDGDNLLLEIYSRFVAIDLEKRRIVRINVGSLATEDVVDTDYSEWQFDKLTTKNFDVNDQRDDIVVLADDIDENQHVNNLIYLRWAYGLIPSSLKAKMTPTRLDIKYEKEIRESEAVAIYTQVDSITLRTYQYIYNKTSDTLSAILTMQWK